ncbi:MAG: hypothetical protein BWX59_02385 [Bacteroidetes bacterium ADurb.Bin028]|nr:MAG: hypothetical protein BWX59_02385 [Bacteroidetes bacterium ADurb.Bin028]
MTNPFKFKDMKIKEFETVEVIELVKRISDMVGIYLVKTHDATIPIIVRDDNKTFEKGEYLLVPNSTGSYNLIKRD